MSPELLGLSAGALFWAVMLSGFFALKLARLRDRRGAGGDDGDQGADWGGEHLHNGGK